DSWSASANRSCRWRCWLPHPSPSCGRRARRLRTRAMHGKSVCRCTSAKFPGIIRRAAAHRCSRPARPRTCRRLFRHLDVDFANLLDRQQALGYEALRDDRFEFIEENVDGINLAATVAGYHALAKSIREIMVDFA